MSFRFLLQAGAEQYRQLPPRVKGLFYPLRQALDPAFRRRERRQARLFAAFAARHADGLRAPLMSQPRRDALVVVGGITGAVPLELFLVQGLKLAGLRPVALLTRDSWLIRYFQLAGVDRFLFWEDLAGKPNRGTASRLLQTCCSAEDLLALTYEGVNVGKYTTSSALARLHVGSLDLRDAAVRETLTVQLASSLAYTRAAQTMLSQARPTLALSLDVGYSPRGELFDTCCAAGIPTVTWNLAHRSSGLILKRYTAQNRGVHPASLSAATWSWLQTVPWTERHRQHLHQELYSSYASGDWFVEVGTQVRKQMLDVQALRRRLGLDERKKIAVIFAHILWDGTLFYGTDLFGNYENWLIETVRAACANNQVNWIIKVHPANAVKNARSGRTVAPAEVLALEKQLGPLPPHVRVLPHTSDINTYSLYALMDYCVTVRGTVGIEAAAFGIPVLTAGTGRYNHKGFTIDSESPVEYLHRLAHLQDMPRLDPHRHELAERFAYGVFVLRPFWFQTVACRFQEDATATCRMELAATSADDWQRAPDVQALARWLGETQTEDFLSLDQLDDPAAAPHVA